MKVESKYKKFFHENAFKNVVCEMAAILSWPQCIKQIHQSSKKIYVNCQPNNSNISLSDIWGLLQLNWILIYGTDK